MRAWGRRSPAVWGMGVGALVIVALTTAGCQGPPDAKRTPSAEEIAYSDVVEANLAAMAPAWWASGDAAEINETRLILRLGSTLSRSAAVEACGDIADHWSEVGASQPKNVKISEVWLESAGDTPQSVKCAMVVPKP